MKLTESVEYFTECKIKKSSLLGIIVKKTNRNFPLLMDIKYYEIQENPPVMIRLSSFGR
jgi:hypothetical protein